MFWMEMLDMVKTLDGQKGNIGDNFSHFLCIGVICVTPNDPPMSEAKTPIIRVVWDQSMTTLSYGYRIGNDNCMGHMWR